ncbi:MAG: hypothetical protein C4519_01215 [Desulfobacteraceae bacterium]|nr:MAG: hypothetical protein C4519_01215 [Desulfobacteraceae bacterium]
MKKLVLIFLLALFVMGCGRVMRSGFLQHDTMYSSWDHTAFSWFGYRNPTPEDVEKSRAQNWWGLDVPYVPGQ